MKNQNDPPPGIFGRWEEKASMLFYRHGLFCASRPYLVIVMCGVVIFSCSYPALALFRSGISSVTPIEYWTEIGDPADGNGVLGQPERWLSGGKPLLAIQQIVYGSHVPLSLKKDYSFLSVTFTLPETLERLSFTTRKGKVSRWKDVCLQEETADSRLLCNLQTKKECLRLAPDLIWKQSHSWFERDTDRKKTVEQLFQSLTCSSESLVRPLLFGGHSASPTHRYQTFTSTLFLNASSSVISPDGYDGFVKALEASLTIENTTVHTDRHLLHALFVDGSTLPEILSVIVVYILVFLYITFSVGKIELVKSKWGLGLTAVITILCSLSVSVGLCTVLGIIPSLNGGEIFPFLVILIGVENVLAIIKAVTSTPNHLEVNVRVAQGLSKEGFTLTKNVLSELVLFTVGYVTYHPFIQEFCLLAIIAILCDFFLQTVFFPSVLSIDIRRMELSDASNSCRERAVSSDSPRSTSDVARTATKSRKRPGKVFAAFDQNQLLVEQNVRSVQTVPKAPSARQPKRLYVAYFIARTKPVQKMFMVCTAFYFGYALLPSVIVTTPDTAGKNEEQNFLSHSLSFVGLKVSADHFMRGQYLSNLHLLTRHYWPQLFRLYNMSLSGRYITVLPPIYVISQKELGSQKMQPLLIFDLKDIFKDYLMHVLAFGGLICIALLLFYLYPYLAQCSSNGVGSKNQVFLDALPARLDGHKQEIECVACDGSLAVSACLQGEIRLWNNASGRPVALLTGYVCRLTLMLAQALFRRLKSNQELSTAVHKSAKKPNGITRPSDVIQHHSFSAKELGGERASIPWCVDISGLFIAAGYGDGSVEIYKVPCGSLLCVLKESQSGIAALALIGSTAHEKRLVLGRMDGSVDFYGLSAERDTSPQLIQSSSSHHKPVSLIKHSREYLATGSSDRTLTVFKTDCLSSWVKLHGHTDSVTALDVNSASILSGSEDKTVRVWNARTGVCSRELIGHEEAVLSVCCSDSLAVTSGLDCQVRVWDKRTGECKCLIEQSQVSWSILLLYETSLLCSGRGCLFVYDCSSGQLLRRINLDNGRVTDVRSLLRASASSVLCNHGTQLHIVAFPSVNGLPNTR
eukprot:m.123716 g.123716  ORF g.123716 m.123716 type:complete len:1087 (+) comp37834_c0_seq16:157-3417(+)